MWWRIFRIVFSVGGIGLLIGLPGSLDDLESWYKWFSQLNELLGITPFRAILMAIGFVMIVFVNIPRSAWIRFWDGLQASALPAFHISMGDHPILVRASLSDGEKREATWIEDGGQLCYWQINTRIDNQSRTQPVVIHKAILRLRRLNKTTELNPINDSTRRKFKSDYSLHSGGFIFPDDTQLAPAEMFLHQLVFVDDKEALTNQTEVTLRIFYANHRKRDIHFGTY